MNFALQQTARSNKDMSFMPRRGYMSKFLGRSLVSAQVKGSVPYLVVKAGNIIIINII